MKVIIQLLIVFIIYAFANVAYFAFLNSGIDFGIVYTTWNEITGTVLTVLCVAFLYISLFMVYKLDMEQLKKNITLVVIALGYSGILYYIINSQIFMLKGI